MKNWRETKDEQEKYRETFETVVPALNGTVIARVTNIMGSCYSRSRRPGTKTGFGRWKFEALTVLKTITEEVPGSFVARNF